MLMPRELHWITLDLSRVAASAVGRSSMLHQPAMLARKGGKDRIYLANRSCVKYSPMVGCGLLERLQRPLSRSYYVARFPNIDEGCSIYHKMQAVHPKPRG